MFEQVDWRWIFLVPFLTGFATRFASQGWGAFSFLCCIFVSLIPLADAKAIGVHEDPTVLFVMGAFLAMLGRFLPDIARWVWVGLGRVGWRVEFALGLAIVLASVLPAGAGRELFAGLAVLGIMVHYGFRTLIGHPPWKKKKGR